MTKFISIGKTSVIGRTRWERAKYHALMHQNRRTCEICGFSAATDAHHAIVKRSKRFPVVNDICNVQMVCHTCHMEGKADNQENKKRAIELSIKYNGVEAVMDWLEACQSAGKIVDEQRRLVALIAGVCPICNQELSTGNLERGESICEDCR